MKTMNKKGGLVSAIEGLILLFMFVIVYYAWIVMYQPILSGGVNPVLSNTAAFPSGNIAILLLGLLPVIVIVGIFVAFFNHVREADRPPQQYGF